MPRGIMNTQTESISIFLTCRRYLYELFQRIFGQEPNKALLDILTSDYTKEVLKLFLEENDQEIDQYQIFSTEFKYEMDNNGESFLDKLATEYTYLFIGPNKLPAPPWESVYKSKERLIFQESTLMVRRAYLEYDYLPANYPHEADDHLALELDFMVHLAKLTEECYNREEKSELKQVLSDQNAFLTNHMLIWIPPFAEQIQKSKTHYLYPQMANLIEKIIKIDFENINDMMNMLFQDG